MKSDYEAEIIPLRSMRMSRIESNVQVNLIVYTLENSRDANTHIISFPKLGEAGSPDFIFINNGLLKHEIAIIETKGFNNTSYRRRRIRDYVFKLVGQTLKYAIMLKIPVYVTANSHIIDYVSKYFDNNIGNPLIGIIKVEPHNRIPQCIDEIKIEIVKKATSSSRIMEKFNKYLLYVYILNSLCELTISLDSNNMIKRIENISNILYAIQQPYINDPSCIMKIKSSSFGEMTLVDLGRKHCKVNNIGILERIIPLLEYENIGIYGASEENNHLRILIFTRFFKSADDVKYSIIKGMKTFLENLGKLFPIDAEVFYNYLGIITRIGPNTKKQIRECLRTLYEIIKNT